MTTSTATTTTALAIDPAIVEDVAKTLYIRALKMLPPDIKQGFARLATQETDATALFPGGFGTHDEGFEVLTLIQTGKTRPRPIVLMEPEGSTYWRGWLRFVHVYLLRKGYIDRHDLELFRVCSDVDDAVSYIENFYRIYHSIRYVGNLTVLRLNTILSDRTLQALNRDFKDILTGGDILLSPPLKEELQRGEFPNLPRLVMRFNRRDYGRLCALIRAVNRDS